MFVGYQLIRWLHLPKQMSSEKSAEVVGPSTPPVLELPEIPPSRHNNCSACGRRLRQRLLVKGRPIYCPLCAALIHQERTKAGGKWPGAPLKSWVQDTMDFYIVVTHPDGWYSHDDTMPPEGLSGLFGF